MNIEWIYALSGGLLIGVAVSLMLWLNGRVAGVSGIVYGIIDSTRGDLGWRIYFIAGLILGGVVLQIFQPSAFEGSLLTSDWSVGLAGIMVGFGTELGSGCTSGHGICGISRLSIRSILATIVFIIFGMVSVFILKTFGVFS